MVEKIRILLVVLLASNFGYAQMGIGTDMPDPAAELEIKSSHRGLLIPRVALTDPFDETTITAGNIESLLVYNTTTNETLKSGFYYWLNNRWKRLQDDHNIPDNIVIWDDVNNEFTYMDSNGEIHTLPLTETLTSISYNSTTHVLTYVDEAGNSTNIQIDFDETLTTLVYDEGTNMLTYTDENSQTHTLELAGIEETLTFISFDADTNTLTYTDENGNTTDIVLEMGIEETLTYLSYDEDQEAFIYIDENGEETVIPMSFTVQETLTTLAYDEDANTLTYTDEESEPHTIELAGLNETLTSLNWDEGENQLVYINEDNVVQTIDLPALVEQFETLTILQYNPETNKLIYTDEQGVSNEIVLSGDNEASNQYEVYETSDDYIIEENYNIILGSPNDADITITLPAPADNEGRRITIKKENNDEDNYLNVFGNIAGVVVQLYTAVPYTGWEFVSDGTQWKIVNKF